MADQHPTRRRFQFRLRTLMIVVTVFAVPLGYVGWQAKIVRERQAWHREEDVPVFAFGAGGPTEVMRGNPAEGPGSVRRWLGDSAKDTIFMPQSASDEDIRGARVLFPEATIQYYLQPWNGPRHVE
jgi:hypothetical protein